VVGVFQFTNMDAFQYSLEKTLKWEGGYQSNPNDPGKGSNREQLNRELRDFAGAVARMVAAVDLASDPMRGADQNKGARYMHHQTPAN